MLSHTVPPLPHYQWAEQSKAETCAELTATTKRRKITERDHSIKARLARAKERARQMMIERNRKKED